MSKLRWQYVTAGLYIARSNTGGLWRVRKTMPNEWAVTLNGINVLANDGEPVTTGSVEGARAVVEVLEATGPLRHLAGDHSKLPEDQLLVGPNTGGCLLTIFYVICGIGLLLVAIAVRFG